MPRQVAIAQSDWMIRLVWLSNSRTPNLNPVALAVFFVMEVGTKCPAHSANGLEKCAGLREKIQAEPRSLLLKRREDQWKDRFFNVLSSLQSEAIAKIWAMGRTFMSCQRIRAYGG